jgi:hypothetical protein
MRILHGLGLGALILMASSASAQSSNAVAVDVTLGPSRGWGGASSYRYRDGVAAEITLALHPGGQSRRVGAITAGAQASFVATTCPAIPGGGCQREFPPFTHVGILGGIESANDVDSFRVLAGPAFYGGDGASGLGGQLQADAATGFRHLAFVVTARGSLIGRFSGERLALGSLGFGFRIR